MKTEKEKRLCIAAGLLAAFVLWTAAVRLVDVAVIGPQGTKVGFATLNSFVHGLTGHHEALYIITDYLGLIPLGLMLGFALLGFTQWIKRRQLKKVDNSILALGGFYAVVMAAYFFFEIFVVNYRPVLIEGVLEASYPSSTTMLVLCVMTTAAMQFDARIKNRLIRQMLLRLIKLFSLFMVAGRLISGVHWFSDIVGAILLSAGLVMLYCYVLDLKRER